MRAPIVKVLMLVVATATAAAAQQPSLEEILQKMETVGGRVRSMECRIEQKKWTHLLKRFDQPETGMLAFKREDSGVMLRRDIEEPGRHTLLIREGRVLFFQPAIKQAHQHELGNNRDKAEFLLLGFGTDRAAIREAYQTRLLGPDTVEGRRTYRLELTPRSSQMAAFFPRIVLWIDAEWWIPIQQQLFEPTQDYLMVRFGGVKLNPGLKNSRFELKLPSDVNLIKM